MRQKLLPLFMLIFLLACSSLSQAGPRIINESFPLMQRWSLPLKGRVYRLAVSDDWIAASQSNSITAIDTKTGKLMWELSFPVDINSLLLFLNGNLVVASADQMKVINQSGEELSTIDFDSPKESAEIVAGYSDYVFVRRTPSWTLEVYHLPTGRLVWEIYVGRGGLSISFDDITDIVYLTTTFFISANDISNGNQIWRIDENPTTGTYDSGVLYYSTQLSKKNYTIQVSAIDTQSLKLFWDAEIAQGLGNSLFNLTVFDDTLLASTNSGLLALDKKDGNPLWKSETSELFYGKPVVINDVIYIRGTTSSVIYAISPADGRNLGTLSLEKSSILSTSQDEYDIVYRAGDLLIFPFEDSVYAYH